MQQIEQPRILETGTGLSYSKTVEYKGRFLYSKYNPSKSILSLIERTDILPGTLIVIKSPCLFYGLKELVQKLPEHCPVLALEAEAELLSLAQKSLEELKLQDTVQLFSQNDLECLDSFLRELADTGNIKRILPLDFSGGVVFHADFYSRVCAASQEIVSSFWKNRITIVKMGRLFSKNIFCNVQCLSSSITLNDVAHTVSKPIIVCGAGESLDHTFSAMDEDLLNAVKGGKFFILAVDAALTSLLDRGIPVDAVVGMESQSAIQNAYIGSKGSRIPLFADLCSRPQIPAILSGPVIFYATRFASAHYLDDLKNRGVIDSFIPPLGSVGLTATLIALYLRKSGEIKVYVTGLDFSYSMGLTHAKGTPAQKRRLFTHTRTNTLGSYDAAFGQGCSIVQGKTGTMISSGIMELYASTFNSMFARIENLIDIRDNGLPLHIENGKITNPCNGDKEAFIQAIEKSQNKSFQNDKATAWIQHEKKALLEARDLLINGENSDYRDKNIDLNSQLTELLAPRDYLYIHFPDGTHFSTEPQFLKRVRAEIDFFLKW
ncbi:MAG: DUF115 domain-containing protein [Treponema sp.]|nr:DUF115 domain-containing protein [Treponema sp.]